MPAERGNDQAGVRHDVFKPFIGLATAGSDLVGRHSFSLSARVSLDAQRFAGSDSGTATAASATPVLGMSLAQSYDASSRTLRVPFPDDSVREFFLVERERAAMLSASFVGRRYRSSTALYLSGGLVREDLTLRDPAGNDGPMLSNPEPQTTFTEMRATLSASNTQRRAMSFSREDGSARLRDRPDAAGERSGISSPRRSHRPGPGVHGAHRRGVGLQIAGPPRLRQPRPRGSLLGRGRLRGRCQPVPLRRRGSGRHTGDGHGTGALRGLVAPLPGSGLPRELPFGPNRLVRQRRVPVPALPHRSRSGALPPLLRPESTGRCSPTRGNAWGPTLGQRSYDNPQQLALASVGAELTVIWPHCTGGARRCVSGAASRCGRRPNRSSTSVSPTPSNSPRPFPLTTRTRGITLVAPLHTVATGRFPHIQPVGTLELRVAFNTTRPQ